MNVKRIALVVACSGLSASAFATDGYFSHGYGMKAKGMGGAATAMADDAFGGANNPASMVWAGDRLDMGLDFFSPRRSISRSGATPVGPGTVGFNGSADSGSNLFYIPELGYNKMLGSDMSIGVTVYGNGGMNTDYPGGQVPANTACPGFLPGRTSYNLLCGDGRMGVDLVQMIIAPTFAMKLAPQHSLGVSLLITHQQFKADGIQSFAGFSSAPNNLSNLGRDKSNGVGLRIGYMGQLSDQWSVGAAYSPKTRMSKFDLYKGLFADQGRFDIPENWNVGVVFKPNSQWKIAADYQRINYGDVPSIGNPSVLAADLPGLGAGIPNSLGCSTCRGFGWSNVDVVKLGVAYDYGNGITIRAGYNHSKNPISARDVTFNMLAPGVVQDHYTLGMTYGLSNGSEVTLAYMHAAEKTVTGSSLFNYFTGNTSGTDSIKMYQDSFGIAYSLKFK